MAIDRSQARELLDDFLYFAERVEEMRVCYFDDHAGEGVEHWAPVGSETLELVRDRFLDQELG